MVFLKVIPTSLLFIHGCAGHCNLETSVRGYVGVCMYVMNSIREEKVERGLEEKSGEAEKRQKWGGMEGRETRAVVWNVGLDFRP